MAIIKIIIRGIRRLQTCPIYLIVLNAAQNILMRMAHSWFVQNAPHEWDPAAETANGEDNKMIKDSNGNILNDGDTISVIKDLKEKGTSSVIKIGTKAKNIRLVDGDHDIECKLEGFGAMKLKSEVVKKI